MAHKKSKKYNKKLSVTLIVIAVVLIVFLAIMMIFKFLDWNAYNAVPRSSEIEKYKKKNDNKDEKTVAWLRVQGTNIDYPVIYAPGVGFGLKTDDFVWTEADYGKLNNIVYISGHNIKNLSTTPLVGDKSNTRFEQLMSFVYTNFVKENQFIQYTIDGHDYIYKVYSVYFDDYDNLDVYNESEYNQDDMIKFINNSLDKSIYDFDVKVKETDKFISLNTCSRMFGDKNLVVNARLLRKGEINSLSVVKENNNYKEIENALKGGDSDEA